MNSITPLFLENGCIHVLDQTLLPYEEKWLRIDNPKELIQAIQNLSIRGAPLLGLAGLYGLFCSAKQANNFEEFQLYVQTIRNSRPTAINLSYVIDKEMEKYKNCTDLTNLAENFESDIHTMEDALFAESESIAKNGYPLLQNGDCILTHCNSGSLATLGWGTALGIVKYGCAKGKNLSVFFTETRPLLQGARLTAYELSKVNIPSTLIVDSAVGFFMQQRKINLVITGADRIAANGDTANKIGTYTIAVVAKQHQIPFYIAAPLSSFDFSCESGADIPVEFRSQDEIITKSYTKSLPGITIINPAFDITPAEFIAGYITEHGILKPPFR